MATYEQQLAAKQKEVLGYQEKYNIRIKGDDGGTGGGAGGSGKPAAGSQGVLVGS